MSYIRRLSEQLVTEALSDTRVVVVNGARQAGKSTLVHRIVRDLPDAQERRLDRPLELAAARLDPEAFVRHGGLLVIDEIQRAPELILPIKAEVDDDPRPGQFLLTGSARLLGLRALPDTLVGRSETVELWPLAQAELEGAQPVLIDALFDDGLTSLGAGSTPRAEYFERLVRGGFPEAVRRTDARRSRFLDAYLQDLVDRDIVTLGDIGRRDALERLLALVAAAAAQLFVPAHLARATGVDAKTVERYTALFEEVFLLKRLPAWSTVGTSRAVQARKVVVVDSGLAANIVGRSAARLAKGDPLAGPLLENFVLSEIARLLPFAEARPRLFHFRTKDGIEVDGVLESRDRRIVGIEVKASESVRAEDLRGLTYLRDRVGPDFVAGVVLHAGRAIRSLGDRLWAVPIDALWS